MTRIIEFFIKRSLFGNFITVTVLIGGMWIGFGMQREALPIVDFDIVLINTAYPGASPKEVEKIITTPIERKLKSVDQIKDMTSNSLYARSTVVVKLEPDIEDKLKIIQDIKDAVDVAKIEFPEDVIDPVVSEITTKKTPVIQILLSKKSYTGDTDKEQRQRELRQYADRLEDSLELIPEVASIATRGYRNREFQVEVSPDKMLAYNISVDDIISALQARNLNLPGGTIIEGEKEYSIRTVKEFENLKEMENLFIRANDLGNFIKLKDIATVTDTFEKESIIEKNKGKDAIVLTILKKEKADAIRLVDGIKKTIEQFKATAPADLDIETANDLSYYIKRRLNVLQGNILLGIVLIIISLYFFLGWRISLMVALGLPFSFALSFFFLNYYGITINMISLFGMIVVSGMLVDDAIVISENIYRHLEQGETPRNAAVKGTKEMVLPVFGSVSTTMVAFAPLMFMGGLFGKFVWAIPAVVIIALASSLFESFFILPSHLVDIMDSAKKKNLLKNENTLEFRFFRWLQGVYKPVLEWSLKRRYLMMFAVFFLFFLAILMVVKTGFILFPKEGVEILAMKFEGPKGISLEEMESRMRPAQDLIGKMSSRELENYQSRIGIHQENEADPFMKRGENYGQIVLYLTPEEDRERVVEEIISYFQTYINPNMQAANMDDIPGSESDLFKIIARNHIQVLSPLRGTVETIPLKTDYLIGGGFISNKTMLLYDASNHAYLYDFPEKRILKQNKTSIPKYDFMKKVIPISGHQYSFLITEKNRIYKIHNQNLEMSLLHVMDNEITHADFVPERKSLYLTTSRGSFHVFSVSEDGELEQKKMLEKGPSKKLVEDKVTFDYRPTKSTLLPRLEGGFFTTDKQNFLLAGFDGVVYQYSCKKGALEKAFFVQSVPLYWVMEDPENNDFLWISAMDHLYYYNKNSQSIVKDYPVWGYIQKMVNLNGKMIFYGTNNLTVEAGSGGFARMIQAEKRVFEKIEFKKTGQGGPPVGSPVQIEVSGEEFDTLIEISAMIQKYLNTLEGVYDVRDNWEEGKEEFRLEINEERAAMAGVSVFQIASTLQTAFEGRIATTVKKTKEEIDIRVLFPENLRKRLSSLNKVTVRNKIGNLVPITELATFKKYPGVSMISHVDGKRTFYILANIDELKTSSLKANGQIMEIIKPIMAKKYPDYTIKSSGEIADTKESMEDLGFAGAVAVGGILAILILLFGNLRHPRVIMMAIPLGFIGVSVAFFLHKITYYPNLVFSFLASMGVIGLAGVVVNDSIVLVDFINQLRKSGVPKNEAIITSGVYRLRAVMLTTITTVFGLIPTAYGIGGSDPMLKPMALAMAWGLSFATFITLIFIPVYYAVWEDRGFVFHHEISRSLKKLEDKDDE